MPERLAGPWLMTSPTAWGRKLNNRHSVPSFIRLGIADQHGHLEGQFQLGRVRGELDCQIVMRKGTPGIEFSWHGAQGAKQASGQGWAVLVDDGVLKGKIVLDGNGGSGFHARPG